MMTGMTKRTKIAVSLPAELVDHARAQVAAHRADSVSAYVAAALADRALHDDLATMLDQMLAASGGPLTDDERRAADEALGR